MKLFASVLFVSLLSLCAIVMYETAQATEFESTGSWGPMGSINYTSSAYPDHPEWNQCQTDSDCELVLAPGCGVLYAANKKYSDDVHKYEADTVRCFSMVMYPANMVAKCMDNICVRAVPKK